MADANHHREAARLRQSLADLFDQIEPGSRAEAEQELRAAGIDPDRVGSRCARLAAGVPADGRRAPRRPGSPWRLVATGDGLPTRRRRLLWIAGAALVAGMAAVALWPSQLLPGRYPQRIAVRPVPPPGVQPRTDRNALRDHPASSQAGAPRELTEEPVRSSEPEVAAAGEAPVEVPMDDAAARALEASGVAPGTVVTASNLASYEHMLSPGVAWAVRNGLEMSVIEAEPVGQPAAYVEATNRYATDVRLSADRRRLEGYTAGLPFPTIDPNDPDAALKIMWNHEYRPFATDDVQARDLTFEPGTLGKDGEGMTIERRIVIARFERLSFDGRLFTEPMPAKPSPEGVRYKERLYPIREPFDLRGTGFVTVRYRDGERADDTWLYLPTLKRVRRLSAAQRSDAVFGQDADLDSLLGFSGQVASHSWKLLGERVILASVHAQHDPVAWGRGGSDFAFDDVWEPRAVYVVEGASPSPHYAYGKRILFIDKETWSVLSSDIHDRQGALWKVWLNLFGVRGAAEGTPGAAGLVPRAAVMLDTQLGRATRIHAASWRFNSGTVADESMTISAMIEASR